MARQSPHRRNAEEPEADLDEVGKRDAADSTATADTADDTAVADDAVPDVDAATDVEGGTDVAGATDVDEATDVDAEEERDGLDVGDADAGDSDAGDRTLWTDARIDPVEIALPAGVGFTLRAYRLSTELTPTEIEDRDDEDPFAERLRLAAGEPDEDEVVILDDEFAALLESEPDDRRGRGKAGKAGKDDAGSDDDDDESDDDEAAAADLDDDDDDDDDDTDEHDDDDEEAEAAAEEVPIFLSHRGKLLLFKSADSLVAYVRSGAPHDLAQLESWSGLAERIQPADVRALDDDSYELDLVVENLRGGHDTWDLDLLIDAGEIARDLAYGLRLTPVLTALSAGSPLDDLDDALRAAAGGGFAGFRGRRRLRRIGAQQASLGWRSVIGKISASVDWRD